MRRNCSVTFWIHPLDSVGGRHSNPGPPCKNSKYGNVCSSFPTATKQKTYKEKLPTWWRGWFTRLSTSAHPSGSLKNYYLSHKIFYAAEQKLNLLNIDCLKSKLKTIWTKEIFMILDLRNAMLLALIAIILAISNLTLEHRYSLPAPKHRIFHHLMHDPRLHDNHIPHRNITTVPYCLSKQTHVNYLPCPHPRHIIPIR